MTSDWHALVLLYLSDSDCTLALKQDGIIKMLLSSALKYIFWNIYYINTFLYCSCSVFKFVLECIWFLGKLIEKLRYGSFENIKGRVLFFHVFFRWPQCRGDIKEWQWTYQVAGCLWRGRLDRLEHTTCMYYKL